MYLITVFSGALMTFVCISAYPGGYGGGYGGGGMSEMGPPKPYAFGYNSDSHFRKEQGDGSGGVSGSYGYTDKKGLFRVVDYIANSGGFQAKVRTNEPGTDGKENPADVYMQAQPSPVGLQGFGQGGMGFGMGGGDGKKMHW